MQSAMQASSCLLKTAIAMVGSSAGISLEGNILFDEGAQRSFISQDMAAKLNLQPTNKENISLASFGSTAATYTNLPTGVVQIQTVTGDKIPVSVLIAPKIAPPLQNMLRTSLQQMPHLKGLHLAHPITENENFEISILIGADYYWSFVQDHVIRGDGPTAVESKLGYLLSGPLPTLPQSLTLHSFHVSQLSIMEAPILECRGCRNSTIKGEGSRKTVFKIIYSVKHHLSTRWVIQSKISLEAKSPSFTI